MTFSELTAFHAVATHGGFTAAAARLGVTQPTLSSQVAALERRFGVTLFDRRGRKVHLTPLGDELLAITRRLFDLEQQAEALLASAQTLEAGLLRVGADSPHHVVAPLASFSRAHPRVRVTLAIGNSASVLADLRDYRIDVAVLADVPHDPRLVTRALRRDPIVLLVRRDDRLAARRSVDLSELAGRPVVMREPGSTTRAVLERALLAAGVDVAAAMEMDGREALHEAVAAGLGLAVISAAEFGADSRLATVPLVDGSGRAGELAMTEYLVRLAERRPPRPVQAFLDQFDRAAGPAG